jgi:hypothetical protein
MSYDRQAPDAPEVVAIEDDRTRRATIALRDLLQTHLSTYRDGGESR